jgi:hypothetical protein
MLNSGYMHMAAAQFGDFGARSRLLSLVLLLRR